MKLESIREEVIRLVEDKSYDPISVDNLINLSLSACAHQVDIPELKSVFTVATEPGIAYIALAEKISNFGGRVKKIKCNGTSLKIYSTLDDMLTNYDGLTDSGDVEACCLEGRNLWYAKVPETAVGLLILCYQNPEPLYAGNPEVSWMPEYCQRKILVGGACSVIFDEKEEEDSGKPVTRRYDAMFNEGIKDLRAWVSKNRRNLTYSAWTE